MKYEISKITEKIWMWIAWHLPKTLVMWASIRLMANATTGQYEKEDTTSVTIVDALRRWEEE